MADLAQLRAVSSPGPGIRLPTRLFHREAGFRDLQVQADSFSIDQHEAGIDELLPGAIKLLIGSQHGQREDELDSDGAAVRVLVAAKPDRGAEVDSVKVAVVFLEVLQRGTNQVSDVLIECQRRQLILRTAADSGSVVVTESCRYSPL